MNRWEKEIQESLLNDEKAVIRNLEKAYRSALKDINDKIADYTAKIQNGVQSAIFQKQYQEQIRMQIEASLQMLQSGNYTTISKYLEDCYNNSYIGAFYNMQKQGVPLIVPINQEDVIRAITLNSKISEGLYTRLGFDTDELKKRITAEVTRGIATNSSWETIAKNIKNKSGVVYSNAVRIARTEGHRIAQSASLDASKRAESKGASVVKQWDSTLDGNTRPTHRELDGQIRNIGEKFKSSQGEADAPGMFGIPSEDINCRCQLLQRATWALKETVDPNTGEVIYLEEDGFTKFEGDTNVIVDFSDVKSYNDFKSQFWTASKKIQQKQQATQKTNSIVTALSQCKTADEVAELMKNQRWFNVQTIGNQTYDTNEGLSLSGCDLESAKSVFEACQIIFDKFPQLIGELNSVTVSKLSGSTYANCHVGLGRGGVTINKLFYQNAEKLARSYESDVLSGFHPVGTNYKSIVVHEFGHAVDDYLTNTVRASGMLSAWKPKWVSADLRPKVMRACGKKVSDVRTEVSGYATKDHYEWFAECFAEYVDSPTPRTVASEFGKQLEEILKGIK